MKTGRIGSGTRASRRIAAWMSLAVCAVLACSSAVFAQAKDYPESYLRYAGDPQKPGQAAGITPPQLQQVTFKQRLGDQLPLDARLRDEVGADVTLGDYFRTGRPVVLAFVYYRCPMLCTQVMNGISSALKVLPFTVGKDFDVVLVSFDPRDTPKDAAEIQKEEQRQRKLDRRLFVPRDGNRLLLLTVADPKHAYLMRGRRDTADDGSSVRARECAERRADHLHLRLR